MNLSMARRSSESLDVAAARLFRPAFHHYPRALAQRDPRPWPARNRCPVGRLRNLEVIDASDVLEDAVRGAVPDIHLNSDLASRQEPDNDLRAEG